MTSQAILYGIGVGPGDPELLTIKAIKCIENVDVLIFPGASVNECRAYKIVENYVDESKGQSIIFRPFPMVMNKDALDRFHEEISEEIMAYLRDGSSVGFVTIGDPTIYSTFSYVNQYIKEKGFDTQTISGISSVNAVAGRLGISLADQNEMVHIIPGSAKLEDTMALSGTRVYMKSGKQLERLIDMLKAQNADKKYQILAVANCGTEDEKVYNTLEEISVDGGYLMTIIVKPS